ncbi:MAG TPA: 50S ribosomal protein L29 [Bacteroidales bacterium]|nr:50S ribosomal protein L29 [Bacteroidales bacterium]
MEQKVIQELSTSELVERLEEEKKQLTKLKLNHHVSPIDNPNRIKAYRRAIARIMTELRKRELQGTMNKQSAK